MSELQSVRFTEPFNGPIEIGLRALVVLTEAFPAAYSLQRLVISDYLVVHSDDADGPQGCTPKLQDGVASCWFDVSHCSEGFFFMRVGD